ncbi:hypothetical protein WKO21_000927 [Shigella boydii]|uniref:hypothetical protein n=1 Tax=Shigella TaxID=620 RepID=UPI00020A5AFA|nr:MULTISPECIES: hypothetical protein [Enterobacteriaceae]EFX5200608.1 hypothetical protein [Shigella flexneri]EGI97734.1 hypothetical protein SB521682_1066 [Shigella boydii 5216-82]EFK3872709.1 bacteriophage CI repressor [Escherichia coli]EFW0441074.1 bacteriophage CI repressor [Shigella boydii]EFW7047652.1 bacteriophage CI repressor [Shigella boydii]
MNKEPNGSFPDEKKEPLIQRLFSLVERYPSRSEAARAWGINISTLNNYYKRRHLNPIPRPNQLQKIADKEGVSLEWLTTGQGQKPSFDANSSKEQKNKRAKEQKAMTGEPPSTKGANIDSSLLTLIEILSDDEKNALFEVLARKGVETLLRLLDKETQELLQLEGRKRLAALMLVDMPDEQVREILEEIEASILSESVKAKVG